MYTALYDQHVALNGKMVEFHGWHLPLHYGSQLDEHHAVRKQVGVFDVSHMTVIDVQGVDVIRYLRKVLANDVAKLAPGQALYSCILNERGGVKDDLIAYKISDHAFRLVTNSATHDKDIAWFAQWASEYDVSITEMLEKSIIALQGPQAIAMVEKLYGSFSLKSFHFHRLNDIFIARTGYTGEQGVEIIAPVHEGKLLWQKLVDLGVQPCGLGARDTLRLEAGLNLYGNDMDETTSPLVSNLAWTIAFTSDRDFTGKKALLSEQAQGVHSALVGLILKEKGVLRTGQKNRFGR